MKEFLSQLPAECQDIKIEPRHKVALHHRTVGKDIWVVLLTTMPGDGCKAWKLRKGEYWQLEPKHGTRDRWIRENLPPLVEGRKNPSKPKMLFLF